MKNENLSENISHETLPAKITYRNFKGTQALQHSTLKHLDDLASRYRHLHWAHCVLKVEHFRHIAKVMVERGHRRLFGEGISSDMYTSIVLAIQKLEKQLVRLKE